MQEENDLEGLSATEQRERVWEALTARNPPDAGPRTWPSYDAVVHSVRTADYNETLSCPHDLPEKHASFSKTLCPHGVVCCAKMELFDLPSSGNASSAYTGLLTPGRTLEDCIVRLSSAMKPPQSEIKSMWARTLLYATGEKLRTAQLFPCAALKVFRASNDKGVASGNLLFGGSKVGQRERDYFSHCLCTTMTETMPRPVKPFVKRFWEFSDYPLSLGLSDFCKPYAGGDANADEQQNAAMVNFPFCLILRPAQALKQQHPMQEASVDDDTFDGFLEQVLSLPIGTHLFDIFACPDPASVPDPSSLQRLGRLVSSTAMQPSGPADGLFFRHQRKEEDYALRPNWPAALAAQVSVDGGTKKGTVGNLAGWKLFEQHIAVGTYQDYEVQE